MQLSTRFTFTHKVVLPAVWLAGFGMGTLVVLLQPAPDRQRVFAFLFALIAGGFMFYSWGFPLKRVIATEGGLLVSNFRREVLVPYGQICAVRENKLVNTITVELDVPAAWGSRFVFRPYTTRGFVGPHPAAILLSERATAARRSG